MDSSSTLQKIIVICEPNIENSAFPRRISFALMTKNLKNDPESLMTIASKTFLNFNLEDSEKSKLVEQILKTDYIEISVIHNFEKHPKLLISSLGRCLSDRFARFEVEIWNKSCRLVITDPIAYIPSDDFDWPLKLIRLAFKKKLKNILISVMESDAKFESIRLKCKRLMNVLLNDSIKSSHCSVKCYSRREIYFDGIYGSHIHLTQLDNNTICDHLNNGETGIGE